MRLGMTLTPFSCVLHECVDNILFLFLCQGMDSIVTLPNDVLAPHGVDVYYDERGRPTRSPILRSPHPPYATACEKKPKRAYDINDHVSTAETLAAHRCEGTLGHTLKACPTGLAVSQIHIKFPRHNSRWTVRKSNNDADQTEIKEHAVSRRTQHVGSVSPSSCWSYAKKNIIAGEMGKIDSCG